MTHDVRCIAWCAFEFWVICRVKAAVSILIAKKHMVAKALYCCMAGTADLHCGFGAWWLGRDDGYHDL